MSGELTTKYRPKKFVQVIGQNDIPIIKAVIKDKDSLPPLLLFCGPSGVGKTTVARVIASYLNCENPSDGEPCLTCISCKSVTLGAHVGVYELDSATNGSAEKLRELVTKSHLSSVGVKTFILDEAQAISGQGWNVLLKVLEEPPPNCIFLLLTSEPKKVPAKIRTRALKFNLKPIAPKVMRWYIERLCSHAKISIDEKDIDVIVDLSEGSVRDALSMLEQSAVVGKSASEVFSDADQSIDYLTSLISKDLIGNLKVVDGWWDSVGDAATIISQMSLTLEKLAVLKVGGECYAGKHTLAKYRRLLEGLQLESLVKILSTISDWYLSVGSKAQIVMLTSKLHKVLHGDAFVSVSAKEVATPAPVQAENIATKLDAL